MKKIIKRIPQIRKKSNSNAYGNVKAYASDVAIERKMMEFEFLHFSGSAVMRKTIDVIA